MSRFEGRTALVTGAARGMGASHARGLVAEGARVVVADVLEDEGRALAGALGERALFVRLDVTSERDWASAVGAAEEAFGPLSVLVNNAGILRTGALEDTDPAAWRQVLDVNLTGVFLGICAVAPSLRRAGGGAIVNVSSSAALQATAELGAYSASKWALRGLGMTAALELAPDRIRVNTVFPGVTETEMIVPLSDERRLGGVATNPIPRVADAAEITRLVLFVASDDAGFSTGSEFVADGGSLLGPVTHERGR